MKLVFIIIGVVAALVIVVIAAGAILPVKHRASRAALFNATPETLFSLIAGPQDWRPDLKSFEQGKDASGREWRRETSKRGETIEYEVVTNDPPHRYAARIVNKDLPYGGQWTYELEPRGPQTELRITEDGEVYNPVFRFVSRFITGHTSTIDAYLQALAHHTGENITIAN